MSDIKRPTGEALTLAVYDNAPRGERAGAGSTPIQILDLAWSGANDSTDHSWTRLNNAMMTALRLAVGSGMTFREFDVDYIDQSYRAGRWLGENGWEGLYAMAVQVENASFIEAFESYFNRKPFRADGVRLNSSAGSFVHRGDEKRRRSRLALGFSFPWQGKTVTVTSFNDAEGYLTAVSRKMVGESERCGECGLRKNWPTEKLDKTFRINPSDLKAARPKKVKAVKAAEGEGDAKDS